MSLSSMYPSMAPAAPEPAAEALITAGHATPEPAAEPPQDSTPADLSEEARLQASGARLFKQGEPEAFVDSGASDEVKALREADGARKMYSPQETFKSDLPDEDFLAVVGNVGLDGKPLTHDQAVQAAATFREIAVDMALSPADVRELIPVFQAPPPSAETQAANRAVAMQWLVDQYGDGAGAALEAAQALVARDKRVSMLLDRGAGDDVRVVKKVVASALRQVASGKLTVGKK